MCLLQRINFFSPFDVENPQGQAPRVNGSHFKEMAGRTVILVGQSIGCSNGVYNILTSDKSTVQVQFPPNEMVEDGYVKSRRVFVSFRALLAHSPEISHSSPYLAPHWFC